MCHIALPTLLGQGYGAWPDLTSVKDRLSFIDRVESRFL
jgi:hypothetical protein